MEVFRSDCHNAPVMPEVYFGVHEDIDDYIEQEGWSCMACGEMCRIKIREIKTKKGKWLVA